MIRAVPPISPSAGRARDQVLDLAPAALGGDREAAVLDEGAGVDQVLDVLAGGAPAGRVAAGDRLAARGVLGQRAPPQKFGEIFAFSSALRSPSGTVGMFPDDGWAPVSALQLECGPFAR